MATGQSTKKIILWASGNGTNAENITCYFKNHSSIVVSAIFTNNPKAGVLERAAKHAVTTEVFTNADFEQGGVNTVLEKYQPDLIVLAGFLRKVAPSTITLYTDKIINVHPALLPNFGGAGMYGMRVHQAVLDAQAEESGITIHYVNPQYDEGGIIFQAKTTVSTFDTPETLAQKIHALEYQHFPKVIEKLLS